MQYILLLFMIAQTPLGPVPQDMEIVPHVVYPSLDDCMAAGRRIVDGDRRLGSKCIPIYEVTDSASHQMSMD